MLAGKTRPDRPTTECAASLDRVTSTGVLGARCVEAQIDHATDVKEHVLANIHKTKKYMLAGRAPRHKTRAMHI